MVTKELHNNGYIINDSKERTVYKISKEYPILLSFNIKFCKIFENDDNDSFRNSDDIADSIYDIYNELEKWTPSLVFSAFDVNTIDKILKDIPDIDLHFSYTYTLYHNIKNIIGEDIFKYAQKSIEEYYEVIMNQHMNKDQANLFIKEKFNNIIDYIFSHINNHRNSILNAIQACYITLARDLQSYEIESNGYTPDKVYNFEELGPVEFYKGKYISTYILTKRKGE